MDLFEITGGLAADRRLSIAMAKQPRSKAVPAGGATQAEPKQASSQPVSGTWHYTTFLQLNSPEPERPQM
jgi:hypothetical protein